MSDDVAPCFSHFARVARVLDREGTGWLEQMLIKMEKGEADTREIPMLEEISRAIEGHTICALGDAAAWPVQVCEYISVGCSCRRRLPLQE